MISILVPVYNYSIINLGKELVKQGAELNVPYDFFLMMPLSIMKSLKVINYFVQKTILPISFLKKM